MGVLEVCFNERLELRQHILNEKNYTLVSTFEPTTPSNAESHAKCLQTIALKFGKWREFEQRARENVVLFPTWPFDDNYRQTIIEFTWAYVQSESDCEVFMMNISFPSYWKKN